VYGARVAAAEAAVDAFARLAKLARRARQRDFDDAGGATPPLLDAVFLVARSHRRKFTLAARRHAAACATAGAVTTLTGPWPAYNFVQDDERGG
jgi:hypothetical protein